MLLLTLLLAYMLPYFVALLRDCKATKKIAILNVTLGWTFIGWVAALLCALLDKVDPDAKPRSTFKMLQYKALVALGSISIVATPFFLAASSSAAQDKLAQNAGLSAGTQQPTATQTPSATPKSQQFATPTPAPIATPSTTSAPTATITPSPEPTPTPFAKRVVKYDLQGEKPDKDDLTAVAMIKKIKWSLNGDPSLAAQEDAAQFLKVAAAMKEYPDFQVRNIVVSCGADLFDKSIEIADKLRAQGVKEDELDKAIAAQNPMTAYTNTMDVILGADADDYWAKALGKMPVANWFDGGIVKLGDLIIPNLKDPKSYQFDHFKVSVANYKGQTAWKVDYWYRAKNSFGALNLEHYFFYIKNDEVVGVQEPPTAE